ncbi:MULTISPECIES: hypothetical protein [Myxococcus]|nr:MULTISPECIES: hypothetical protein [Myxococcus]NOJ52407.1 hypothetical protein [Myxococcus xanthus]QPM78724.1 hypothetical protein I5Q59_31450 [Myxococcus xanthus]QVW67794.1 hypothetical protein JTM82_36800 [Myxococcus xanthus DZ2]QZZ54001.1 hypothetical protein MyxoNM_32735 [Myxococcus xanthus]UEO06084.1 hypothetical protein K1515_05995 [Myxococcus xanthus DZ2]
MPPFIIRTQQGLTLQHASEARFRREMVEHLRTHFPERTTGLEARELDAHVERALQAARDYGLASRRELCRFLNLCGLHGWDFDRRPRNAWMKAMLTAPDVTAPGARLDRLVEHSLHRLELESHRTRLEGEFGLHEET